MLILAQLGGRGGGGRGGMFNQSAGDVGGKK